MELFTFLCLYKQNKWANYKMDLLIFVYPFKDNETIKFEWNYLYFARNDIICSRIEMSFCIFSFFTSTKTMIRLWEWYVVRNKKKLTPNYVNNNKKTPPLILPTYIIIKLSVLKEHCHFYFEMQFSLLHSCFDNHKTCIYPWNVKYIHFIFQNK